MRHLSGAWALTRPKSRTGRVAPLVPPLTEALRRHLAATADQPNPHGLVWHDGTGEPIRPKDDDQQWRELLLAADIISEEEAVPSGTKQTGHWARHTMITILAGLGADYRTIGDIVGQSSAEVTDSYRHVPEDEKRAAATKLGGALANGLKAHAITTSRRGPRVAATRRDR
jgi:site-specific recombinase XerD